MDKYNHYSKAMEIDARRRFFISLLFSIPVFLYSPISVNFFKLELPRLVPISPVFPDGGVNWLLLILTTPIVFWAGSIFIDRAYYSLKVYKLNAATLITIGMLTAYIFSAFITLTRPESETFYGAAAMLATFALFSHWIETVLIKTIGGNQQGQQNQGQSLWQGLSLILLQRVADKAADWLATLAVIFGLAAFFGWYFYGESSFATALTFAISTVIIACPAVFSLAISTVAAAGMGIGAKHNIFIKNPSVLERASKINAIIFDKQSVLTESRPKITNIEGYNGFSANDVLRYKAVVEAGSNHPLAKAILDEAKKRGAISSKPMEKFESFVGLGVKAQINGQTILAGKEKFFKDNNVDISEGAEIIKKLTEEGKILSLLAVGGIFAGTIAAADIVKPMAKKAISEIKSMGIEAVMITSDHIKVAEATGKELKIEKYFAEVLPSNKIGYVKKLQTEGSFVGMVGDGINDAAALAQADVGVVIGDGIGITKETSDIILVKSDIWDIVTAIKLSRATVRKMKQNLWGAAIYNVLAIPAAAGVFYNLFGWRLGPEISILLMSAAPIMVIINAITLKKIEPKLNI